MLIPTGIGGITVLKQAEATKALQGCYGVVWDDFQTERR